MVAARDAALALPSLVMGGGFLCLLGVFFKPHELGLSRRQLPLKLMGGLGLAAVLLLPTVLRAPVLPRLPLAFAVAAVMVSVGEEVAFRGVLYAALDRLGGARLAIAGSSLLFLAAHVLSHPPAFWPPVLLAGLLLAVWRWACKDLVAPIVAHTLADLAL